MWQYVFLLLRRQLGKSALASSGFLLAACALILLSATTQTTVVQGSHLISQNWRPTYDLVVLPPKTQVSAGQNVPADFLQNYDGGISMQQYAQIKHLAGVEVAAPIAYIGYLALPPIVINFTHQNFPAGYYQMQWTVSAFTGQQHIIEYQQSEVDQIFPCADIYDVRPLDQVLQEQSKDSCPVPLPGLHPILNFETPDTGGFLFAAIDPAAENQLVHLNKSITTGRMLNAQDTIHADKRALVAGNFSTPQGKPLPVEAIPMLIHQNLPGQISLAATLTQLTQGIVSPSQLRQLGGVHYLTHLPHQRTMFNGLVPIMQHDPQHFTNTQLAWDGHQWKAISYATNKDSSSVIYSFIDFSSASTSAGLIYRPTTAPNGSPASSLVPIGVQGPEVTFRPQHPLHTLKTQGKDVIYSFESVGQFADKKIVEQFSNSLNWLPENTYTTLPVVLRYDAQGHPVAPQTLLPTTNHAGYVVQPPLALTTLAVAQQLRGNTSISAIRVRIAGVDQANQDSWKRVQQVAGLIEQRTHLPVRVTLGSSPRPTLLFVPGVKQGQFGATQNIAPIGWVEERWLAIGASVLYLTQLGETRLLLVGAVLVVCLGYLLVSFSTLVSSQSKHLAILSALGWRPRQTVGMFLGQAVVLSLIGGIVGMGLALLIILFIGADPPWEIVGWTLPAVFGLGLISVLYPLWHIWHIPPAEVLRADATISWESSSRLSKWNTAFWSRVPAVGGMALRNLTRSRWRAVITMGSLFLSAILLTIMIDGVLSLHQSLQGTAVWVSMYSPKQPSPNW